MSDRLEQLHEKLREVLNEITAEHVRIMTAYKERVDGEARVVVETAAAEVVKTQEHAKKVRLNQAEEVLRQRAEIKRLGRLVHRDPDRKITETKVNLKDRPGSRDGLGKKR